MYVFTVSNLLVLYVYMHLCMDGSSKTLCATGPVTHGEEERDNTQICWALCSIRISSCQNLDHRRDWCFYIYINICYSQNYVLWILCVVLSSIFWTLRLTPTWLYIWAVWIVHTLFFAGESRIKLFPRRLVYLFVYSQITPLRFGLSQSYRHAVT